MRNTDAAVEEELARLVAGELDPKQFPHREHLRLAYEMLERHPFAETVSLFSIALRKLAAKGGRPELYHDTMTVAFLAVIAERRAVAAYGSFASFIAANPDLLDKHCLERWYDNSRLQSDIARQNFILPDDHFSARQKLRRTIAAYTAVYVALIIWASVLTLWRGLAHQAPLAWLALAEIAGACLFLFKETRLAGLILLLLVFSVATVADSLSGSLPIRFLIYGASAILAWRLAALADAKKPAA
jgi:hypothetical protein